MHREGGGKGGAGSCIVGGRGEGGGKAGRRAGDGVCTHKGPGARGVGGGRAGDRACLSGGGGGCSAKAVQKTSCKRAEGLAGQAGRQAGRAEEHRKVSRTKAEGGEAGESREGQRTDDA